jgi:extradiol dioxygenase family protein
VNRYGDDLVDEEAGMPAPSGTIFHQALAVRDLNETRAFYGGVLGCEEGKSTSERINFSFFGHHLVAHLVDERTAELQGQAQKGRRVAWRHCGVILEWPAWQALAQRLTEAGVAFVLPPQTRNDGLPSQEALMFLRDPAGNGLEFKAFRDIRFAFQNG